MDDKTLPVIGPALPPRLSNVTVKDDETKQRIGPALPLHLQKEDASKPYNTDYNDLSVASSSSDTEDKSVPLGPALPPHFRKINKDCDSAKKLPMVEPGLHLDVLYSSDCKTDIESNLYTKLFGPALPDSLKSNEEYNVSSENEECNISSDEDVYGPLPPDVQSNSRAHVALEERALKYRMGYMEPKMDEKAAREEWMVELPAVRTAGSGIGPRQFRKNAGPDMSDRSWWTDTPKEKAKNAAGTSLDKVDLQQEFETQEMMKRDVQHEHEYKQGIKKRTGKSLLEIDRELKKKKKQEDGITRRPFNRDIDLRITKTNESFKTTLQKGDVLDSKFATGQMKYL